MKKWKQETKRYKDRIDNIQYKFPDISSLLHNIPKVPLEYEPSSEGVVAVRLANFNATCFYGIEMARTEFLRLWQERNLVVLILPVRFMLELWGAVHFSCKTFKQMHETGNVEKANEISLKLTQGSRIDLETPWGGIASEKSINVMDFIRSLKDVFPNAVETYESLCESCHPSFLMLSYWAIASMEYTEQEMKSFDERIHSFIDTAIALVEKLSDGVSKDLEDGYKLWFSYIHKDRVSRHINRTTG